MQDRPRGGQVKKFGVTEQTKKEEGHGPHDRHAFHSPYFVFVMGSSVMTMSLYRTMDIAPPWV